MEYLIIFITGFVLGFILCKMFFSKSQESKLFPLNSQSADLNESKIDELAKQIQNLRIDKTRLEEALKYSEEKLETEKQLSKQNKLTEDKLKEFLSKEFEGLVNKALKDNSEALSKNSKTTIESLLNPVKDRLKEFQDKVEKFNSDGQINATELKEQINYLKENNNKIISETTALTNALKTDKNVKGYYGESLLATLLESVGLIEGKQYDYHNKLENGIPDFIINLPNKKGIIIDSKNVLESYVEFTNEENKEEKEKKSKAFKTAVKARIKELDDKHYNDTKHIDSLDFILMFIPVESSLNILYDDIDLIKEALSKNVIIVGSSSLLTTLRLISYLWKQQDQCDNAKEIAKVGADLYDGFAKLLDKLTEVQKKFDTITELFKSSINIFTRGKDSLFNKVEDLRRLGVNPTSQIPENFLEASSDIIEINN